MVTDIGYIQSDREVMIRAVRVFDNSCWLQKDSRLLSMLFILFNI